MCPELLAPPPSEKPMTVERAGEMIMTTTFRAHDGAVSGMAFSKDGGRFATCSDDETVLPTIGRGPSSTTARRTR